MKLSKPNAGLKWSELFRCAWRGGVGAMIGPLGFILFMAAKRPNDALAIGYLPIILPITAVVGAMIGVIIGLLHFARGLRVGRIMGVVIGTALSTCLWMGVVYLDSRANDTQEFSWLIFFGRSVFLGLIVGALAGMLSVPQKLRQDRNRANSAVNKLPAK